MVFRFNPNVDVRAKLPGQLRSCNMLYTRAHVDVSHESFQCVILVWSHEIRGNVVNDFVAVEWTQASSSRDFDVEKVAAIARKQLRNVKLAEERRLEVMSHRRSNWMVGWSCPFDDG